MTNNPGPVPISSMHQNGFIEECTSDDGISSNQCHLCISIKLNFFLIFCLAIPLGYMCLWIDPPVKRTNNKNLCFPTFTEHHLFSNLNGSIICYSYISFFLQYCEDFAQKLYLLQNSGQFGSKQHSLAAGRVTDEKFDRELSVAVTLAIERTFTVNILHLIIEGVNGPG